MFAAHNALYSKAVKPQVLFKGATTSASSSVTLPSHQSGDLIVLAAFGGATMPSLPPASGTDPSWTSLGLPTNSLNLSARFVYTVATASNHTSGTFTSATYTCAAVLSGQAGSPFGQGLQWTINVGSTATCPSTTLTNTDGSSQILHIAYCPGTWLSPLTVSGYTLRLGTTTNRTRIFTKDSTTSDGSVAVALDGAAYWLGSTLEILA